jgi:signal transduction histidine kinase/DNA-binding response OmpR family regulator
MTSERIHVLAVEDDRDHAELIRRVLERHQPPFNVTVVHNAAGCLEALDAEPYAVVLLDYSLPGMNGLDVLERIRQHHPSVPVVMITGHGDERIAVRAMNAGGIDYVVKTSGYLTALPTVLRKALKQHELAADNARLYEETQRRLHESQDLLELARSLTSTLEYRPLIEKIAHGAARVCRMDRSAVLLWDDERPSNDDRAAAAAPGGDGLVVDATALRGTPMFAELVDRREPVAIQEPSDPRAGGLLDACRVHTMLLLPLIRRDEVTGALVLADVEARPITGSVVTLGIAVASQAALAIDNARLYRDAQRALADLTAAQERLVRGETLRALGELASGAAHHLNNLLAVVAGRAELLLLRPETEAFRRQLEVIARAANDGAEVVRRIQQFSRTRQIDAREPVDLNELAREVVEMTRVRWRDTAQAQGVRLEVECEAGSIPPVNCHPASIREVVTNLVLNAVDALPGGGTIRIRTWLERTAVALAVTDDGVGMPDDVRRRAQEPFFTTKGLKSTGLGLSVSYGILERHGGELSIDSLPGRGTTITMRLPIDAPSALRPRAASPSRPSRPLDILVVDDELEVRTTLGELLEADGHAVAEASGPHEALARLESGLSPNLVLTDLGMPEMTGWQLAGEIKRRWPEIAIGLMTGWGSECAAEPADRAAVDFVAGKPLSLSVVREHLAHLRCGARESSASACVGAQS